MEKPRNFPAIKGPSYLGVHLRFGTVSLRHLVNLALRRMHKGSAGASTWLAELVWRDFYFQILANFPHVAGSAFKPEYDAIQWQDGEQAQPCLLPGARAALATRWWMRPWRNSIRPAICTTACAW